jgi:hypothetical protein
MERFAIRRAVPGTDDPARRLLHRAADHRIISDYSNVHADVQTVTAVGLLDPTDDGVSADCDVIETAIAI